MVSNSKRFRSRTYLVFLTIVLLFSLSCSTEHRYNVLSFFFDGVPIPGQEVAQTGTAPQPSPKTAPAEIKARSQRKPQMYYHDPYKERECGECHNLDRIGELQEPVPDLCFSCHDDFREELPYPHGPAASGACTNCHHPHFSKHKKMLVRPGDDLCLFCHLRAELIQTKKLHKKDEDKTCTDCHNAHGGENKNLLKKEAQQHARPR